MTGHTDHPTEIHRPLHPGDTRALDPYRVGAVATPAPETVKPGMFQGQFAPDKDKEAALAILQQYYSKPDFPKVLGFLNTEFSNNANTKGWQIQIRPIDGHLQISKPNSPDKLVGKPELDTKTGEVHVTWTVWTQSPQNPTDLVSTTKTARDFLGDRPPAGPQSREQKIQEALKLGLQLSEECLKTGDCQHLLQLLKTVMGKLPDEQVKGFLNGLQEKLKAKGLVADFFPAKDGNPSTISLHKVGDEKNGVVINAKDVIFIKDGKKDTTVKLSRYREYAGASSGGL